MCTALYQKEEGLFGRTLDLERSYGERVVITPRGYGHNRYALVGTATVAEDTPLYYDALNEMGLAMAGLNLPHSAYYPPAKGGAENLGAHQLIPTLLGRCGSVEEAVEMLGRLHLCDRAFSDAYPVATLHWMLADREGSVVIEATSAGVQVQENPVGVLTNEPPFPRQLEHLDTFFHLSHREPLVTPPTLGRGSSSLGLPGDYTSPSRFVRGAFGLAGSLPGEHPVGQFFHLMSTVEVPRGSVLLREGRPVISRYTCCMDLRQGAYYFRTYGCHRLHAVGLRPWLATGSHLVCYPHPKEDDVAWEN